MLKGVREMKAILVIDVDEKSIGREVNYIRVQGNGYSYIVKAVGENVRLRPLPKWKIDGCSAFNEDGGIVYDDEVFDWVKELIE